MNVYGKENLPKLDQPTGKKYYYAQAESFKAIDTSSVESAVKTEFNTLKSDIETAILNFNKRIQIMEQSFGVEFIAINEQPLGFVDMETFDTLTKTLTKTQDINETDIENFFDSCKRKTEDINYWLKQLSMNYSNHTALERNYQKCINSDNEEIKAKASAYQAQLSDYQQLPAEPLSYGDWIKE